PDFPTGGVMCGRSGIRQGYLTGRATITLRAKTHFDTEKKSEVIVVTEIPYQETRDRIREKLEALVRDDRIKGIARIVDLTDRNVPPWQVLLHIVLKRDADRDVVLNQLFRYSPLQSTVSIILLALVGNRPQILSIKDLIQEFLRHRIDVIRRRTEFLLAEARKRKHTVEGLLIAQINIDQVIKTIRNSSSRAEARERLQEIDVPSELVARALGEGGFRSYLEEQGEAETYRLSANQAEAIVSMQLGSLANLERENLQGEHRKLLDDITGWMRLLSDEANIRNVIREDMQNLQKKHGDKRRTEISEEELTDVNRDDLITEEPMVVTLSQRGYVKRIALNTYRAQQRGGKGVMGAKADDEDPISHLFVASTHDYLLFFTNQGKVYWKKVYDLPLQRRTSKGRALVNLLKLQEGEKVSNCIAVREFTDDRFLIIATLKGLVKKTALTAYSRPLKGGLIAIKLDAGDDLIDVRVVSEDDDVVLATRDGMSIRFSQEDARSTGRATRGVKGINLSPGDSVIGMVVADPEMTLLTVCENGFGKRTAFGPGVLEGSPEDAIEELKDQEPSEEENLTEETGSEAATEGETSSGYAGSKQYRRQRRGGKGLRDIQTTARNGKVIDILAVAENDDVLMVTSKAKIQRIRASNISRVGRNTQGVRVIRLAENDKLVSMARIPSEVIDGR
ncbi:MAG: DNA gyrase subunit A, partial [Planctomycetes bacterium]|nr:DNA gyrase subunit A [Planctomycetota bacterium]